VKICGKYLCVWKSCCPPLFSLVVVLKLFTCGWYGWRQSQSLSKSANLWVSRAQDLKPSILKYSWSMLYEILLCVG
jgi:hypothetical protein